MNHLIALLLLFQTLALVATASNAAEATPNDVYAQAVRIEHEVEVLKRHFKITDKARSEPKSGDIKPRHTYARAYGLLYEIGKLRRKLGLPYLDPVNIEPTFEMQSNYSWAMTQRILTEIAILKYFLDIPGQAPPAVAVSGKRMIDVYNKLHQISAEMDFLHGGLTPSDVYGQAKRLNEDVNALLRHQRIFETAVPPPRRDNLQPKDSLKALFAVMAEIQRLQRAKGLPITDFKGFEMGDKTTPDDVFSFLQVTLAELQQVKVQFGMTHHITPPAPYEENKTPADVVQLLGYVTDKLQEIRTK